MSHLLMNESNPAGLRAILLGWKMGVHTTFVTADAGFYRRESAYADEAFRLADVVSIPLTSTLEEKWQIIQSINQSRRIDGICTPSEYHIGETAVFARRLGHRAISVEGARNCRFKQRTRTVLARRRLPQPDFRHIPDGSGLRRAIEQLGGYPVVAKAVEGTAGLNVMCLQSDADADTFLAKRASFEGYGRGVAAASDLLVEKYVAADLLSVESCVHRGEVRNFGITTRKRLGFPRFIEMGGVFLLDHPRREELFDLNVQVLHALGVAGDPDSYSFIHTEFLLQPEGPPLLCEVNGRLAGGILPRMFEAASGIQPYIEMIRQALGEEPNLPLPNERVAAGRQFGAPVQGRFAAAKLDGLDRVPGFVEAACYGRAGHEVPSLTNSNFDWLGHVIYTGTNAAEATERAEQGLGLIRLELEVPAVH